MNQNEQHLQLLSIFHYVLGGITALFSLLPAFHLMMGLLMLFSPGRFSGDGQPAPFIVGLMFVLFPLVFMGIGWIMAGCIIATGRFLAKRKYYTFCLVVAGVECMLMPFGTALGVFTILVLMRDSVKEMFKGKKAIDAEIGDGHGINT